MKKRIFALALALCMMLSVMPTSFAGNGFLTDDSKAAPQSGILTDDSKTVSQSGVLTGASKYYRQDGILYNTGSQSGASYSLPSGTLTSGNATTFDNSGGQIPAGEENETENINTSLSSDAVQSQDSGNTEDMNPGIETRKQMITKDGKQYLRLESYVTGSTTTSTRTTPLDIVLVLDQSGSMGDDFGGNSTDDNTARRQYAMKKAVVNFVEAVSEKYNVDGSNHRMAIVTFSDSADTLQGWTDVDGNGKNLLENAVNGLPDTPYKWGGTRTDLGMSMAQRLIEDNGYSGENTTRQPVVILFTDGAPGSLGGFEIGIADAVIPTSKALKDDGCLVYTIGIFDGADPAQLYGSDSNLFYPVSNGSENSIWRSRNARGLLNKLFGGVLPEDVPACNRFLNYVSSNYEDADEIGLEENYQRESWGYYYYGYKITKNVARTSTDYYMKATDADSLNNIFETITDTITSGSASVQLGTDTVVQDVISDYFKLPAGAGSQIKVYVAPYTSSGTWGDYEPSGLTAQVTGKTVKVTGFDFSANYCAAENGRLDAEHPNQPGSFYGRKLIIEIPIEQEPGFLGGQNVPTNAYGSGIYKGDNTLMEIFKSPTMNVSIPEISVTAKNKNIYLSDELETEDMLRDADVYIGSQKLKLDEKNFGLEPWQYAFLKEIKLTTAPATWNGTEGGTFTVTCTVTPNHGDAKEGTSAVANIYVFKPEITFNDTTIYLGTAADYSKNHSTDPVVWKHGTESSTDKGVKMTGTCPSVTVEYNSIADYFTECKDVSVSTVKLNGNGNYVTDTTFWNNGTKTDRAPQFTVHVVKPVITSEDITIYLSNTVDLNGQMTEAGNWVCGHTGSEQKTLPANNGETRLAPTINYAFKVGDTPVSTPAAYRPLGCTEINVAATVNSKAAPISTNATTGKDYSTFWVHVLKPAFAVNCTDLWADYGTNVTLANHLNTTVTGWSDSIAEHTGIPIVTGSAPTVFTYTYEVKDVGEKVVTTHTVTENDADFTVELASFKIGALDCGTRWSAVAVNKVDGDGSNHNFTIHTNKFDLTIHKTWNGAAVYKQDAIFTVNGGRGPFQVVLPAGQDSIVIKGLLCGQKYEVTEDGNWTWRWKATAEQSVNCESCKNDGHHDVNPANPHDPNTPDKHGSNAITFENILNRLKTKWFDFCTLVMENIFGVGSFERRGN